MSIRQIVEEVGASKGSVSLWVRDIELTDEQKAELKRHQSQWGARNKGAQVNRESARQRRRAYQNTGRAKAREGSPLHLDGLYVVLGGGCKDTE